MGQFDPASERWGLGRFGNRPISPGGCQSNAGTIRTPERKVWALTTRCACGFIDLDPGDPRGAPGWIRRVRAADANFVQKISRIFHLTCVRHDSRVIWVGAPSLERPVPEFNFQNARLAAPLRVEDLNGIVGRCPGPERPQQTDGCDKPQPNASQIQGTAANPPSALRRLRALLLGSTHDREHSDPSPTLGD